MKTLDKDEKKIDDERAEKAVRKMKDAMEKMLRRDTLNGIGVFSKPRDSERDEILQIEDFSDPGPYLFAIIKQLETRCDIIEALILKTGESKDDHEKRTSYALKKIILVFTNKKGDVRRTIITEKQQETITE